jgi:hypothetical protein
MKLTTSGRALSSLQGSEATTDTSNADDDFDVPEEVEGILEDIFPSLQDRVRTFNVVNARSHSCDCAQDTIVRWSAAKSIARICERLPSEFTGQVAGTILGLFSIHSIGVASLYDMPAIAESTWQGACLACAELTRRSLFPPSELSTLVDWMLKVCLIFFLLR